MIDGLNFASFDFRIALYGELDALGIDFAIARRLRITNQTFPRCQREPFALIRR